jgi:cytoskeletal protein CcmA (bactofilin family)
MLGNKKAGFSGSGSTTLVSKDTRVIGDIHFSGSIDIEGVVQGNILAEEGKDALVRVIDTGCIEGDIRAPSIVVNGTIHGDVHSSKHLELAPKAQIEGDVFYALVEMAAGAEVNGRMRHIAAEAAGKTAVDPSVNVLDMTAAGGEQGDSSSASKS